MAQLVNVSIPAVPHLPNGGMTYEQRYQNELNNILRLYLDRLTAALNGVTGTAGGFFLEFPHIAASDSTDQYADGDDTPTVIAWNTEESNIGFTLGATSALASTYTGVYKITYSLQFVNTDNAVHDAYVWLRINGDDVANSTTNFSIPARKSLGVPSYVCGYSEVVTTITANDEIELYWATDKAYNSTGPVNGVYIYAEAAQVSPYARPAIPSAIGSITFVSGT
mgnify:FL=1